MRPVEPPCSSLEEENAQLREQVAALQQQAAMLQARHQALMEAAALQPWLTSPDGTLLEAPGWNRLTGLSPEPACSAADWSRALHPDDRERVEREWAEAVAARKPYELEYRIKLHDGSYRWFVAHALPVLDAQGQVREWVGASRDIEREKRLAEAMKDQAARIEAEVIQRTAAMRKSEAMLAEAQQIARIGSWELDVASRELTWSDQQCRLFGLERSDGKVPRALAIQRIAPADLERHEAVMQGAIERGEPFTMDYRVVHPDGRVLHLHSLGRPVFDAEQRVVKMRGTSQDVTERKRLEEQLRAQYEQLMELDQLKSNFVNSVTHELRTPLTSIMGYAEFLEDEIGGPVSTVQREFILQIQRGAMRLEYLLNDLLDFARMEAGTFSLKVEPAELGAKVREVVESLKPQVDETATSLIACLPESPLELEMDPQRISQVLTNLLSNAIKFTPKGGQIRISLFGRDGAVRCEIADTGPGITPEDHPRLFQRFSQLEAGVRMGKGAGLGLSISKALVEAHGGTIGVESHPGAGSTFWFELPVKQTAD